MPANNFSAASDKGLLRGNNEDSYLSVPEHGLWLVADGMGGHAAGEVASAIVADTIRSSTRDGRVLVDSIQQAHECVLKAAQEGVGAAGMGSTVVALKSGEQDFEIAWVGDSRAYLWTAHDDGGTLEQLSTDHSYVQLLLASGAIAAEEAASHPDKNVITQCIGSQDLSQLQVDSIKGQWRERQWILLCSDGLTDELSDEDIARVLCESPNVRDAVKQLLQLAISHGGRDNVTLQIIESPLTSTTAASRWERLPRLTASRWWDGAIATSALLALPLLCFWLFT